MASEWKCWLMSFLGTWSAIGLLLLVARIEKAVKDFQMSDFEREKARAAPPLTQETEAMSDVVVTVPRNFKAENYWNREDFDYSARGLKAWISEGDVAGNDISGTEWHFSLGGNRPKTKEGERVYIVCEGKLRGYSPLLFIDDYDDFRYALVRCGGAVAVTIDEPIQGFRGFRYRWWDHKDERPFPDWQTP